MRFKYRRSDAAETSSHHQQRFFSEITPMKPKKEIPQHIPSHKYILCLYLTLYDNYMSQIHVNSTYPIFQN